MAFQCYARIYLPLNSNGIPDTSDVGWYDLQINSQNDAIVPFDDHTKIADPVFCYGEYDGAGAMKIFTESKTGKVMTDSYLLCKYAVEAANSDVADFLEMMLASLEYISGDAAEGNYALYRATKSPFSAYSTEYINSFYATAFLCDYLGDGTLLKIYNKYCSSDTDYLNYAAWEMFDQYYKAWEFADLNR